ncbi:Ubiquitin-associated and SH3 domain-containing protein B [Fasciola hepatica]|uniref:Ubiquitin-associated and SH3 domain-containing protein B n=1 Tax=Fasciola hepatica TaxID=6192 RepID=A0A2H1BRV3_FASHE|nr:Ubiquitin-associated and SH3 domain-containing protein B [Fasciola hepatica]
MPSTYGCPVLSPTICDEDDPSSHHPSCDSPQCGSQDLRNRKDTSLRTTTERHPSSTSSSSSCPTNSKPVNLQSSAVAPSIGQPGCITGLTSMRNSLLLLPHPCSPSSLSHPANGDVAMSGSIIQSRQNSPNLPSSKSRVSVYFRPVNGSTKGRQLFVMRHAERVDICFGRGWVTRYFDKKGVYRRLNLNLPTWLPPRADYLDYVLDSPITQVGLFVAAETGRALAEAGVQFTVCYSSPSLRCVQTACELLRAMGRPELLVRIEPHLFEWFGWYGNCAPRMMNLHDLRACGYQVDVTYRALSSSSDFDPEETISNYYERTGGLTKRILSQHKSKDACILIVAHASSLDTCTHQLVHHGFRTCISSTEFHHRTSGVPYCGLVVAQENRRWSLVNPPIPNVCSHTPNPDFDWRQLLSPTLCGFPIK